MATPEKLHEDQLDWRLTRVGMAHMAQILGYASYFLIKHLPEIMSSAAKFGYQKLVAHQNRSKTKSNSSQNV